MSSQITTAFVQQYSANIQMLSQQMGSLLRDKVRLESVVGKNAFFDPGETGSTSTVLPSTQKITESGTDGLTIAKLRTAKEKFDLASVDPSIARFIVVSPRQITDLLGTTEVTSSDFNTVKALANGEINSFLGFNFIVSNRLSIASSKRSCIAFAQDGITLAVGKDVSARIDERADKSYATQVYYCMSIGATRMEEEKVVEVQAHEA
jgi:hypothetical protein